MSGDHLLRQADVAGLDGSAVEQDVAVPVLRSGPVDVGCPNDATRSWLGCVLRGGYPYPAEGSMRPTLDCCGKPTGVGGDGCPGRQQQAHRQGRTCREEWAEAPPATRRRNRGTSGLQVPLGDLLAAVHLA